MLKRNDIIIFISVIVIAALALVIRLLTASDTANTVIITQNDEEVFKGSLYENKIITLEGNTIEIKDGTVDMIDADCKNQICVDHKPISKNGESIICLPNKVIVEIH